MLPGLSMKLAVFDRKVALVPVSHGPRMAGSSDGLIVHACSLLDALIELFERLWVSAMPLDPMLSGAASQGPARPTRSQTISPQESQLVTLLLAGMTDDAIGRQLGLARRTVVRRVHHLMTRAKAANRLQLILRAAQLGWVDVTSSALPAEPAELPGGQVLPTRAARADAPARLRSTPPLVHRDVPPLTVVAR
jgi:DNA-binding CsgD family transcriptional regulator